MCLKLTSSSSFRFPSSSAALGHDGLLSSMGRAKLQIAYREQDRARRSTYMTRWKGLKKKAEEICVLCGVDVLVVSRSPEFNAIQFWPEKESPEFQRIKERYLCLHKQRNSGEDKGSGIPCLPIFSSSSSSSTLFHEEMAAMEIKLKEIRERLQFLTVDSCAVQLPSEEENLVPQLPAEEELLPWQFMVSTPLQQIDPLPYDQSSDSLPADFNMFLQQQQQDDHLNLEQISPPFPPHDHPIPPPFPAFNIPPTDQYGILYPFEQPFHFLDHPTSFHESLHHLVEPFNAEDLLPSNSPLWSNADDLNWAHSVFLDFESPV